MNVGDWSSDVCSSDLQWLRETGAIDDVKATISGISKDRDRKSVV